MIFIYMSKLSPSFHLFTHILTHSVDVLQIIFEMKIQMWIKKQLMVSKLFNEIDWIGGNETDYLLLHTLFQFSHASSQIE